ncbi:YdcF family protein [Microvirga pakistanensis]|uniref:YdcF family protein n=1 Tax=Microvirga pakistanensis TaxID=1682650 RepID=UPI00141A7D2A|nr:YdcF family protein [Microvirga pakistanensis]
MDLRADNGPSSADRRPLSWAWLLVGPPLLVLLGALAYGALLLLAGPLLWMEAAPKPVDAIVVLGGDGPRRAERATQLYKQGLAPYVLVAGDGDCLHIALAMINGGVPASAIEVECQSGSTWENALFSAPLLARDRIGSALLVTSWFHTRRSLASFQSVSPDIEWLPVGTPPCSTLVDMAASRDGWAVVLEYFKIAGYVLKYHLDPLPALAREQAGSRQSRQAASRRDADASAWQG